MHKNISGFTLIEILISLFVFSIAVLGFLRLDLHSQALIQEASQQQQKQQELNQFYEIIQIHDANKNNYPALTSLTFNQLTLRAWQRQLQIVMPNITVHYAVQSPRRLQVSFCDKDNRCDNFVVQV